ncbi:MAG: hypothetical protein JWN04_1404 [Myxococcaceae bacterium]|nr:hypothetical protein [Myxococcaceae bacterium]
MSLEHELLVYLETDLLAGRTSPTLRVDGSLFASGLASSVDLVELLCFLSTRYDVNFEPGEVAVKDFDTVRDIANIVRGKVRE